MLRGGYEHQAAGIKQPALGLRIPEAGARTLPNCVDDYRRVQTRVVSCPKVEDQERFTVLRRSAL